MNAKKGILLAALILILIGGAVFFIAFSRTGFDFETIAESEMRRYELRPDEPFEYISAVLNDCSLTLAPSPDGKTSLEIFASDDAPVAMTVENGVLRLEHSEKKSWFRRVSFLQTEAPSVTIWLPEDLSLSLTAVSTSGDVDSAVTNPFGNVSVTTVSGDITWNGDTAGQTFDFSSTSGDILLTRASLTGLTVSTVSGNIEIGSCTADGALTVGTTSGDTLLSDVKADSLVFHSVSGGIRTENAAFSRTAGLSSVSGEMQLGDLVTDGLCQISTTSGDVSFVRARAARFDVETVSGDVTGGLVGADEEISGSGPQSSSSDAAVPWKVTTTTGYVHLYPED